MTSTIQSLSNKQQHEEEEEVHENVTNDKLKIQVQVHEEDDDHLHNTNNQQGRRPVTTTADTPATNGRGNKHLKTPKGKNGNNDAASNHDHHHHHHHAFRFPRFGMKSPSPKTSRRLRSFPFATSRHQTTPPPSSSSSVGNHRHRRHRRREGTEEEEEETDRDMTETARRLHSSNSSTTTASSTSVRRRGVRGRGSSETREDDGSGNGRVVQRTKIMAIQQPVQEEQPPQEQSIMDPYAVAMETDYPSALIKTASSVHSAHRQQQLKQRQSQIAPLPCCGNQNYSCATAILQHSYLEMVCGPNQRQLGAELDQESSPPISPSRRKRMPDDPTVQDSIECVFASQLEEGLPLWVDVDNDDDDDEKADVRHCNTKQDPKSPNKKNNYSTRNIYTYDEEPINAPSSNELPSPATLMQSRQKSRTSLPTVTNILVPSSKRRIHVSNNQNSNTNHLQSSQSHRPPKPPSRDNVVASNGINIDNSNMAKVTYQTAKIVHMGTVDPRSNRLLESAETSNNTSMKENSAVVEPPSTCHAHTACLCRSQTAPVLPPEHWPQRPLLLRPTPNSDMAILGVRFSGQSDHFWTPEQGGWWMTRLYELAGKEAQPLPADFPSMCSQCCLLPINNGNEPRGESLVVDFTTCLFEGSLLLRLRHVDGGATCAHPDYVTYNDEQGYFAGLNRRYQVVIRGKFKREIPVTELVSGMVMDRPTGRLPAKWIIKGAMKVLSFFAPQLEVQFDGPHPPKTLAPLGSTPQVLIVQEAGPNDELPPIDHSIEEPKDAQYSLLNGAYPGNSSLQRARGRKKAFDKLYASKSKGPVTRVGNDTKETYYTFEFLQHLVNFQEFSVELGSLLGSVPMAPIMNGQPLPIMAMTKDGHEKLWSFDIWHEELVKDAKKIDATFNEGNRG